MASVGATAGLAGCGSVFGSNDGPSSPTESNPLSVEFFGGVFKEVLDKQLVAPFEEETGIPVETSGGTSASEPVQLQSAVKAGEAPIDLVVATPINRIRGQRLGIWHTYDPGELENSDVVLDDLLPTTDQGEVVGTGAFGWFATLVSQTDLLDEPLDSWSAFWDSQYEGSLALSDSQRSGIIDITAEMFFDGRETLQSQDGLVQVLEKVQELKSQVSLWYNGEAEAQQALLEENVSASWLFHDVTLVMEDNGEPVKSVFPSEGAVQNDGAWVILDSTNYPEEAIQFIDYSLRPDVQQKISENLFTAPVIEESALDMGEDLYSRVYGPGPEAAIRPDYEMYLDREEWLSQRWREMILS
ncbi:extracellular solute-binding protein [Haloarcula sp. S1CR25-12]|uniref:Extracellular solute-binding protein n=1 Tax=Haloarcula saliterrae TaxID=2950534 RepID=A0ABU2FFN5_9EURY|nr:extracellular solute-binding protein [Haloarcula sp. S1CR25-12]MDS0261074.1 extracellular solute-binding protein [Haloarcula sp. S1CR25-12]